MQKIPSSKNPVKDALDLVKKYDKTIHPKFGVTVASKGDIQHEGKKKSLEQKLLSSKQQVVQHLRISRSIERSILQTEIVEKAIKTQLINRVEKDSAGKVADRIKSAHRQAGSSVSQSWLADSELRLIEDIHQLDVGHARVIQSTLNRYDDSKLCTEMASVPNATKFKMNSAFFAKIAGMASDARITSRDAQAMYEYAGGLVQRRAEQGLLECDISEVKWEALSGLLRSKLRVLELSKALMLAEPALPSGSSLATISTSSSMSALKTKPKSNPGVALDAASTSSWDDDALSNNLSIALSSKDGGKISKSSNHVLSGAKHASKQYSSLMSKYDKSQSRQLEISDQMIANLSKISQSVHIDEKEHASAMHFARKVAINRLELTLMKVVHRALKATLERWQNVVKFFRYQVSAVKTLKSFAAFQLNAFLAKSFESKLRRGMKRLKKRIEWFQDMEQISAIAEIQRYWRGSLCRKRNANKQRNIAATQIQKIARGRIGKAYAIKHAEYKHLRKHALTIERAYLKYRWKRIRKNVRVFKHQKKMTERIQRVYRGHRGRKKVRRIRNQKLAVTSTVKIQNVWRRYKAITVVDKKMRARIRYRACAKMQSMTRGVQSRVRSRELLKRYRFARKIQCCIRSFVARAAVNKRRRSRAALNIQRVCRGRRGRKRFAYFLKRKLNFLAMRREAVRVLHPILTGHATRRKWVPVIREYIRRRKKASTKIECLARKRIAIRRVVQLKKDRDDIELQLRLAEERRQERIRIEKQGAKEIQRIIRGFLGRRKAARRRAEVDIMMASKMARVPAYYRLREEYYRSQNLFHRPYLIRIQCAYRCMLARMKAKEKKRKVAAKRIEAKWLSYVQIRNAKAYVSKFREERRKVNAAAVQIQRIIRGFLGRYEAKKHEHAEIFKWFITEVNSLGMIGRALQNFRVRKRTQEKIHRQMIKAQALVRRFLTRCKFLRGYKRLVRERDARRKKRRVIACTTIQGFARIIKAQKSVLKRKAVIAEELRLKGEMEDLDNRIDGMHADWTKDLLAIRIETQVRGNLGKVQAEKKEAEVKANTAKMEAERKAKAATRIQAMARGVKRRKLLKTQLPALRTEKQKRSFCVECEAKVATKRCRSCKDRYCENCFMLIHRKGARRQHSWEPIQADARSAGITHPDAHADVKSKRRLTTASEPSSKIKAAGETAGAAAGVSKGKPKKSEWTKYFDDAAKAHYWFSEVTGEARWTDPNA